ncbi:Fur family transcriptional regulator [Actinomadura kijaniata]|uniref:Fe2+ or Zn2+ uptake regulation protein n=1 Tax=Actinomadura namibiensis TaxID=182080 RepID=A0A7W3QKT3_ACTNM|nr:Fur family transcriptional regulator [Actinomadura namibiensis]MBA8950248.1 Fe2+ or Zn2+ uptake regulation protein [Actinomadura namibiensis]
MAGDADALRARGVPATPRRLAVLAALARQDGPRSALALHSALCADGADISLTTVYRALATLARAGLVHAVDHGTETVYLACGDERHVHLVCRVCGLVAEAEPVRLRGRSAGRPETRAFLIEEVHGVCGPCRTAPRT